MAASRNDIQRWFESGVEQGATHMVVVCDTFDHEDYPVYVKPGENASEVASQYSGKNMQRVMEVYRLSDDMVEQLNEGRVYRV